MLFKLKGDLYLWVADDMVLKRFLNLSGFTCVTIGPNKFHIWNVLLGCQRQWLYTICFLQTLASAIPNSILMKPKITARRERPSSLRGQYKISVTKHKYDKTTIVAFRCSILKQINVYDSIFSFFKVSIIWIHVFH